MRYTRNIGQGSSKQTGLIIWISALATGLLLTGCAETTVIPATATQESISNTIKDNNNKKIKREVEVFYEEQEVSRPYENIAQLNHVDPGKFQYVGLGDVLPILRKKGRMLNADGVIIDKTKVWRTGLFSVGIIVRARAIRYTGVTTQTHPRNQPIH